MGKERDKLIKNHGGTPFSESGQTIRQSGMKAIAEALARGELPDALSCSTDNLDNAPATTIRPRAERHRGGKEAVIAFHSTRRLSLSQR